MARQPGESLQRAIALVTRLLYCGPMSWQRRGNSSAAIRLFGAMLAMAALVVVAGCSRPGPVPTPVVVPTVAPASTPTPTATPAPPTPTLPPPTPATPTPVPPATPTPEPTPQESLFLEISEPENESVFNEEPIVVRGFTTPDAVVSVNGDVVDVDAQGEFAVVLSLEPGPNIIEIVASDMAGDQESAMLAVIYIP